MTEPPTAEQPTWLPSDLMDEMIPPPRPSPDAWITSFDDGAPALDRGEDDETGRPRRSPLKDGEIVNFQSCTHYGCATLTLKAGREWSVDRPMPPEAENVCAMEGWQIDTLAPDVEGCAQALFDTDAEPDDYELSYYTWSADIPHRFDIASRKFKPVGPSNG
jgi:hypothetical protein